MGQNCYPASIYQLHAASTPENTQCARHGLETGAALLSLSHCSCPRSLQPHAISCSAAKRQRATFPCSFRILSHMGTSQNNPSTPPEESVPDAHSNTVSPGGEQSDLSLPEQARPSLVVENPSEPSSLAAIVSAAQTVPTRPTSSSSDLAVPSSKPVPALPREHAAEASTSADGRPRVVSATLQVPTPAYGGRVGGGGGRAREDILPRRSVRVTRSDATLDATVDEAAYAPRSVAFPRRYSSHRRSSSQYLDSEAAWHAREPVRPITCLSSWIELGLTLLLSAPPSFRSAQ